LENGIFKESVDFDKAKKWIKRSPGMLAPQSVPPYKASVRVKVNGRTQVIATEIRAPNAQDARWLLWAMYGFHSIQVGPALQ
jgi:hypothetical protein